VLVEQLLASADRHAGRVAVRDPTRELSWADLVRLADVLRRHIANQTDCPRVGIMLPSSVGFAAAFYGALWAGRTVIPLNFLLQPGELARVVADAGIDAVFTIKHFAEMLKPLPVRSIFLEDLPLKRDMILERLRFKPSPPAVAPDDVAVILYTSGTSGEPKGVCLTYRNLVTDADGCIAAARLSSDHRFLGILPLFHTFGLTAMLIVPVALGATVSYMPRFSLTGVVNEIRVQRITV
jgi:long-chain acyl-CoA synthetase